jgi:DNA-directed RNA polymerase specialized sigma24 family protein
MLSTRTLRVTEQAAAVESLERMRRREQQLHTDRGAAVEQARAAGLPEATIAEALGVHRGTLVYRHGRREEPRGLEVDQDTRQIVTMPRARTSGD